MNRETINSQNHSGLALSKKTLISHGAEGYPHGSPEGL